MGAGVYVAGAESSGFAFDVAFNPWCTLAPFIFHMFCSYGSFPMNNNINRANIAVDRHCFDGSLFNLG